MVEKYFWHFYNIIFINFLLDDFKIFYRLIIIYHHSKQENGCEKVYQEENNVTQDNYLNDVKHHFANEY